MPKKASQIRPACCIWQYAGRESDAHQHDRERRPFRHGDLAEEEGCAPEQRQDDEQQPLARAHGWS
jgi:hypothetical protein